MHIKVRVRTDAKKEIIIRKSEDLFNISVREPAERGMANKRIIKILQSKFPNNSIKIVSGHHSPSKTLTIL